MSELQRRNLRRLDRASRDYLTCAQIFFMHAGCLLVIWVGFSAAALLTCLVLYLVRVFALTAGFHRLFSHRAYQTGRVFQFLLALVGTTAYQKGPLWWSAHHRHHHIHAETEDDPHSPVIGSWWMSHLGWLLSSEGRRADRKLVPDLAKYPELRWLDKYYPLPPSLLAVAIFLWGLVLQHSAPTLGTSGWQMLVWGFFISTVLLYHATFTVNSLAHLFGRRRFATKDNSRNNLFVALITLGEGWHNNHHHCPSSERQGLSWWEIDVCHYVLWALSLLGVVWGLRNPYTKKPNFY